MKKFTPKPYWLIHHRCLLEWATEPIRVRRSHIRRWKSKREIPVRLKWMKPVKRPDLLPREFVKCFFRWHNACQSYLWTTGNYWYARMVASYRRNWKKIVRRHKKEYPGCPFDYSCPDGNGLKFR